MTDLELNSRIDPQVRENVARVMVAAMADYSERRYAAGWLTSRRSCGRPTTSRWRPGGGWPR